MFTSLISLFIAFALILIAGKMILNIRKINKNGINAEGIIFDLHQSIDIENNYATSVYPIVRFLTKNKEWITKPTNIGVFPGIYKQGKAVQIVYQENNPNNFYIKDRITQIIPFLMLMVALFLIIISIIRLISI
jgi:hypothetical protein